MATNPPLVAAQQRNVHYSESNGSLFPTKVQSDKNNVEVQYYSAKASCFPSDETERKNSFVLVLNQGTKEYTDLIGDMASEFDSKNPVHGLALYKKFASGQVSKDKGRGNYQVAAGWTCGMCTTRKSKNGEEDLGVSMPTPGSASEDLAEHLWFMSKLAGLVQTDLSRSLAGDLSDCMLTTKHMEHRNDRFNTQLLKNQEDRLNIDALTATLLVLQVTGVFAKHSAVDTSEFNVNILKTRAKHLLPSQLEKHFDDLNSPHFPEILGFGRAFLASLDVPGFPGIYVKAIVRQTNIAYSRKSVDDAVGRYIAYKEPILDIKEKLQELRQSKHESYRAALTPEEIPAFMAGRGKDGVVILFDKKDENIVSAAVVNKFAVDKTIGHWGPLVDAFLKLHQKIPLSFLDSMEFVVLAAFCNCTFAMATVIYQWAECPPTLTKEACYFTLMHSELHRLFGGFFSGPLPRSGAAIRGKTKDGLWLRKSLLAVRSAVNKARMQQNRAIFQGDNQELKQKAFKSLHDHLKLMPDAGDFIAQNAIQFGALVGLLPSQCLELAVLNTASASQNYPALKARSKAQNQTFLPTVAHALDVHLAIAESISCEGNRSGGGPKDLTFSQQIVRHYQKGGILREFFPPSGPGGKPLQRMAAPFEPCNALPPEEVNYFWREDEECDSFLENFRLAFEGEMPEAKEDRLSRFAWFSIMDKDFAKSETKQQTLSEIVDSIKYYARTKAIMEIEPMVRELKPKMMTKSDPSKLCLQSSTPRDTPPGTIVTNEGAAEDFESSLTGDEPIPRKAGPASTKRKRAMSKSSKGGKKKRQSKQPSKSVSADALLDGMDRAAGRAFCNFKQLKECSSFPNDFPAIGDISVLMEESDPPLLITKPVTFPEVLPVLFDFLRRSDCTVAEVLKEKSFDLINNKAILGKEHVCVRELKMSEQFSKLEGKLSGPNPFGAVHSSLGIDFGTTDAHDFAVSFAKNVLDAKVLDFCGSTGIMEQRLVFHSGDDARLHLHASMLVVFGSNCPAFAQCHFFQSRIFSKTKGSKKNEHDCKVKYSDYYGVSVIAIVRPNDKQNKPLFYFVREKTKIWVVVQVKHIPNKQKKNWDFFLFYDGDKAV